MRPVLHGDMTAAARALLCLPERARSGAFDRMLLEAEAADKYRKKKGLAHPIWGNGSLMAAANTRPQAPEPFLDCVEYCGILALAFERLLAWRLSQAAKEPQITS